MEEAGLQVEGAKCLPSHVTCVRAVSKGMAFFRNVGENL